MGMLGLSVDGMPFLSSGAGATRRGWMGLTVGRLGVGWRTWGMGSLCGGVKHHHIIRGSSGTHTVGHAAFCADRHGVLGVVEPVQVVIPSRRQRPDTLALGEYVEDPLDHHRCIACGGWFGTDWRRG